MKQFPASLLASNNQIKPGVNINNHTCVVIEANSLLEAEAIAHRAILSAYPVEDGWRNHAVGMRTGDYIITEANCKISKMMVKP